MDLPSGMEPTLRDYLGVLRRRGATLCTVVAVTVLVGVLIAYRLPPSYASTGVLLAEQPEVPEHIVRSTVPYDPDNLVRIINQRVLTQENLAKIVSERELYPALSPTSPEALEEFRAHLAFSAEDPDVLETLLGPSQADDAMAFSVTFMDASPRVARDVAQSLMALYLDENQRARREQADDTTEFLREQANRLDAEIAQRETKLAAFKSEHIGSLPSDADQQILERAQRDLESIDDEIRSLRERRDGAASALAQLSPNLPVVDENGQTILGADERRTLLERRYSQLSAIYSQDHPDVLKVRRELDNLRGSGAAGADQNALRVELAAREEELAAARTRYSADHPDVQRLERTVAGLRSAVAAQPSQAARPLAPAPDNPLYIQRQEQVRTTQSDLNAALQRRAALEARLVELDRNTAAAPEVERELNTLNRGYEQLLAQYDDVQAKLREAEIAANLESAGRGDRFTVLQAPQIPTLPESPNRIAILLLTLVVAFTLGMVTVSVAERYDATVRHPRDVAEYFGAPPLVAVPFVFNADDVRRRAGRRFAAVLMSSLWLGAIVFLVMTPA
jgi:uncharacterized protein involved in exopolysaccharide biosynthesis